MSRARYWFRLALPTGERLTVWACTARGRRVALTDWRRHGIRVVAQGVRR